MDRQDSIAEHDVLGLFINNVDGTPLVFSMGPTGAERQLVKQLVEDGGGIMFGRSPNVELRDKCIKLITKGEIALKKDQDMFDYKYVVDCARAGRILPNLLQYRINTQSQFAEYDPVDILLGSCQWSTLSKRDEGERVSDIEDVEEHDVARADREFKMFKSARYSYSKKEQLEMLQFIFKRKAYKLLKGNVIWQRMEENDVCGGRRTWQSMKEHFRKQVMPKIQQFGITIRQIRKLRECYDGFDLDALHSSDESTDAEDKIQQQVKKRIGPVVVLENKPGQSLENRPGPSSENKVVPSLVSKTNGKLGQSMSFDGGVTSDQSFDNSEQPLIANKKSSIAVTHPKQWLGKAKMRGKSGSAIEPIEVLTFDSQDTTKEDTEVTDKSEIFKTAENLVKSTEKKLVKHGIDIGVAATGLNKKIEEDPEALRDQSQVPPHLRSMRLTPLRSRKRKLLSHQPTPRLHAILDNIDESVDMFEDTPPRGMKRLRNGQESINQEEVGGEVFLPGSSLEFGLGLKQVSGGSVLSLMEVDGAVTSTQCKNMQNPTEVLQDGQGFDNEQEIVMSQSEEIESVVDQQETQVTETRNVSVKLDRRPVSSWRKQICQQKDTESHADNSEDLRKQGIADKVGTTSSNVERVSTRSSPQERDDKIEEDIEPLDHSLVNRNSREVENIFSQTINAEEREIRSKKSTTNSSKKDLAVKKSKVIVLDGTLSQNELIVIQSSEESQKSSINLLAVAAAPEVSDSQEINNLLSLNTQDLQRLSPTSEELLDPQSQPVIDLPILNNDTYTLSQPHFQDCPIIDSLKVNDKEESIQEGDKEESIQKGDKEESILEGDKEKSIQERDKEEGILEGDKDESIREGGKERSILDGDKNGTRFNEEGQLIEEALKETEQEEIISFEEIYKVMEIHKETLHDEDKFFEEDVGRRSFLKKCEEIVQEEREENGEVNKEVEDNAIEGNLQVLDGEGKGPEIKGFSSSRRKGKNKLSRTKGKKKLSNPTIPKNLNMSDGDSFVEPSDDEEKVDSKEESRMSDSDINSDEENISKPSSKTVKKKDQTTSKPSKKAPKEKSKNSPYFHSLAKRGGKSKGDHREVKKYSSHLVVVGGLPSDMDSSTSIELVRPGNVHMGVNTAPRLPRERRKPVRSPYFPSPSNDDSDDAFSEKGEREKKIRKRRLSKASNLNESEVAKDSDSSSSNIGGFMTSSPKSGPTRGLAKGSPIAGSSGKKKVNDSIRLEQTKTNQLTKNKSKLKIVAIGKENDAEAGLDYLYEQKFRTPYSHIEDRAIINYFLQNRGFSRRKGTSVWKLMEKVLVAPGRTWQSMKTRWNAIETRLLIRHGVTMQDLLDADVEADLDQDMDASITTNNTTTASTASSGRNPYTVNEDLKIVKFIVETKRYDETGGTTLWKTMEMRNVVPNRSWHSLKERFRKVIIKKIDQFEMAADVRAAFKGIGEKKADKEKRMEK